MTSENEKAGKEYQPTADQRLNPSSNPHSAFRNPLVVALDVDSPDQALLLVERLRGVAGMLKVGKQLFTAAGPEIVRKIIA
ncbi:MAG TPA: orotidine 5'-phosphate decarboxylase / HUMPS family protein, partial [Blastocatellia bacterium]|nr:orotidine 5'-phosphate decarboxylase / HUMPS family protein [Blastocatellia bacterium]